MQEHTSGQSAESTHVVCGNQCSFNALRCKASLAIASTSDTDSKSAGPFLCLWLAASKGRIEQPREFWTP